MAELTSRLFTEGDPAVVKKLDDCARGRPSEVASHFTVGDQGEHIRRVQVALQGVRANEPGLGIPSFDVNGEYDEDFAKAVARYKERRGILNWSGKVDAIVGIKTIRSLDNDAKRHKREDPSPHPKKPEIRPRPAPVPRCMPDSEVPASQQFEVRLLGGGSGGEIVEIALYYFAIWDRANDISTLYKLRSGGLGAPGPIPFSPAVAGAPKPFETAVATRVTRFGPVAFLGNFTDATTIVSVAPFSVAYKAEHGKGYPQTPWLNLDTGPINFPGLGGQGGHFSALTMCRGERGAIRGRIGLQDLDKL